MEQGLKKDTTAVGQGDPGLRAAGYWARPRQHNGQHDDNEGTAESKDPLGSGPRVDRHQSGPRLGTV